MKCPKIGVKKAKCKRKSVFVVPGFSDQKRGMKLPKLVGKSSIFATWILVRTYFEKKLHVGYKTKLRFGL